MEELNLRLLLRPLLKWWWLIAACALLAGLSSGLYTLRQPLTYISRTTIMVGSSLLEPNPNSNDLFMAGQLASAYADIVQRSTIRAATQEKLGMDWLPYYTARLVPNTQLIEISVIDSDPVRAQAVATELVNQLLQIGPAMQGGSEYQTFIEDQLSQMEKGITETTAEIERVKTELTGMFSARQIQDTRAQITALEAKLATLQANFAGLLANSRQGATNTIHVLEPANLPTAPMSRALMMNITVAAALGFALAAAAAYVMHYLDNTLQSEEDVQDHLVLPTLGLVPKLHAGTAAPAVHEAKGEQTAALNDVFTGLRLNIQAVLGGRVPKTLLVGSPAVGDGKSSVAASLALAFADAGYDVLLVDADLRRPSLHRVFHLHNQSGLTTLLLGEENDPSVLIQQPAQKGLSVLTSGPLPSNPTHLLSRKDMRAVLVALAQRFDIVLLDTPPLTATVDASILATQVEAMLLVIAAGRTKRGSAVRVVKSLRHLNINLVGVALNGVPVSQADYRSDYGYTYDYFGQHNAQKTGTPRPLHLPSDGQTVTGQTVNAAVQPAVNGQVKHASNPLYHALRKR